MTHVLTTLLSFCLLPMAQRSQISQDLSLFCTDFLQHQGTFPFPLPHHCNHHSPFFPSSPPSPSPYSSSPFPSLRLLLLLLIQRVWMGQAVSPFEAMGQRKICGDNEGGLWVGRLPHPGHSCSCSSGKILLTILFPLFVWRARCIVGNRAGGKSQRNVLCPLPSRLAWSGATVVPLGLTEMLNHKFQVHRVTEGFGFEAGNQEQERNRKRGSIRVLGHPSTRPRDHKAGRKAARRGQFPHRPRHFRGWP